MEIIIIDSNGDEIGPMDQAQAQNYLRDLIEKNRFANLSQSLNDVVDGKGKATGDYTFNDQPVLHASSGIPGVKSVSLFFFEEEDIIYIIAMGEHKTSTTYKLTDYGQHDGDFKYKATITL